VGGCVCLGRFVCVGGCVCVLCKAILSQLSFLMQ
jgi:hypothetical protein